MNGDMHGVGQMNSLGIKKEDLLIPEMNLNSKRDRNSCCGSNLLRYEGEEWQKGKDNQANVRGRLQGSGDNRL